jgi:hypothetical protein
MKLPAAVRKNLPTSDFAGPDRSFPIEDENHGRAALSMAHFAPDPGAIRAKVHARFPGIGKDAVRNAIMSKLSGGKGK